MLLLPENPSSTLAYHHPFTKIQPHSYSRIVGKWKPVVPPCLTMIIWLVHVYLRTGPVLYGHRTLGLCPTEPLRWVQSQPTCQAGSPIRAQWCWQIIVKLVVKYVLSKVDTDPPHCPHLLLRTTFQCLIGVSKALLLTIIQASMLWKEKAVQKRQGKA